jgi:hypothetical protein
MVVTMRTTATVEHPVPKRADVGADPMKESNVHGEDH